MDPIAQLNAALLGRYDVLREIGAGGMATVYLARDLRHERQVALKVLKPELGAVLGVERFLSEIKVTANLQHPNLLPLFDSGEANGLLFYVMPFVDGESLRAKLERERQFSVDDAVRIATSLAGALDYAHERGVIHRDLKPENVLMQSGQPMIADFGIALAVSNAGGQRVTKTGLSLGTPQYMSPEQAAGDRQIDGRSDIYALGCILYEMLVGAPPHVGATVQATIAKVLTEKAPSVRIARPAVSPAIAYAVERALQKIPGDRWERASRLAEALQGRGGPVPEHTSVAATPTTRSRLLVALPWMLLAAVAVAAVMFRNRDVPPPGAVVTKFEMLLPAKGQPADANGSPGMFSPDGKRMVYVGVNDHVGDLNASKVGGSAVASDRMLWLREVDQLTARAITNTDGAVRPVFSPSGRYVAFLDPDVSVLRRVDLQSGAVNDVMQVENALQFGFTYAWINDDTLVTSGQHGVVGDSVGMSHLRRVAAAGGAAVSALRRTTPHEEWATDPFILDDHDTVVFLLGPALGGRRVCVGSLRAGTAGEISDIVANALVGVFGDHLVFARGDGALYAVAIDRRAHKTVGGATPLGETVEMFGATRARAALSATGALISASGATGSRLIFFASGQPKTLLDMGNYAQPRFSADGARVTLSIGGAEQKPDIYVLTLASGTLDRLTTDGTSDRPEWSPDGARILFRSRLAVPVLKWKAVDGSGQAEQLSPAAERLPAQEGVLSPDGATLLYRVDRVNSSRDIFAANMTGDRTPRVFLNTEFDELTPRFSPDGRWVTYVSNESGHDEVYVRPYPGPGGRTLVSNGGGSEPLWARDGRRVFYRAGSAVVAATISMAGAGVTVAARDTILRGNFISNRLHPEYDISPDGKSPLMLQRADSTMHLMISLNWGQAVLGRLVRAK